MASLRYLGGTPDFPGVEVGSEESTTRKEISASIIFGTRQAIPPRICDRDPDPQKARLRHPARGFSEHRGDRVRQAAVDV